ncbi:MAG: hypothetical protein ACTHJM_01210 [Marmoricola sp.]
MPERVTVVHKVTGYIETVPKRYFETLEHVFRLAVEGDFRSAYEVAEAAIRPAPAEAPADAAPAEVKEG